MAEPIEALVIRSESEAWEMLQRLIAGDTFPDSFRIVFDGWPVWRVKISGKDWNSTVPTRVMTPLLEVQKDLYRTFVQLCYGTQNLRRLTTEDRNDLELVVEVKKGSSEYETPLYKQLTELAEKAIEKMESRHIALTVVGVALIWGGNDFGKQWLAQLQQQAQMEQTVELSKQETERVRLLTAASRKSPEFAQAQQDMQQSQNRLLKAVKPTDEITLSGVELPGSQVAEITVTERASAQEVEISGTFRVLANDTTRSDGFRIRVSRISDGEVFYATVPVELPLEQQRLIQRAEWSKGAKLVDLRMNGTLLRDRINNAVVYHAEATGETSN